ncbi:hypothetical protein Tco_0427740 [Tanacetum coccineum]
MRADSIIFGEEGNEIFSVRMRRNVFDGGEMAREIEDMKSSCLKAKEGTRSDLRDLNSSTPTRTSPKRRMPVLGKSWISSFGRLCGGDLRSVFASIEDPLSAEALIEPSAEVPATNVLSTVVIVPPPDPSIFVEDYDNPDPAVLWVFR